MSAIIQDAILRKIKTYTEEQQVSILNALLDFQEPALVSDIRSKIESDLDTLDFYELLYRFKWKNIVTLESNLESDDPVLRLALRWCLTPLARICLKEQVPILENDMPTAYVKKLAEQTGKSIDEVEAVWAEAKKEALKTHPQDDPQYWGLVTTITKNKLGIKEKKHGKD